MPAHVRARPFLPHRRAARMPARATAAQISSARARARTCARPRVPCVRADPSSSCSTVSSTVVTCASCLRGSVTRSSRRSSLRARRTSTARRAIYACAPCSPSLAASSTRSPFCTASHSHTPTSSRRISCSSTRRALWQPSSSPRATRCRTALPAACATRCAQLRGRTRTRRARRVARPSDVRAPWRGEGHEACRGACGVRLSGDARGK